MSRDILPEQLEIISKILDDKDVVKEVQGMREGMSIPEINAVVIKILSITIKRYPDTMDQLAILHSGKTKEEIDKLPNGKYSAILREAIVKDVLGFFG